MLFVSSRCLGKLQVHLRGIAGCLWNLLTLSSSYQVFQPSLALLQVPFRPSLIIPQLPTAAGVWSDCWTTDQSTSTRQLDRHRAPASVTLEGQVSI